MNKLVESPLEDHARFFYTSLVNKHYSIAQLNFIIAKLSSFILKKKNYQYFPATTNFPDELIEALPIMFLPLLFLKSQLFLLQHLRNNLLLRMSSRLQTQKFASTHSFAQQIN